MSGGWTKEAAERLPQALAWYEAAAALQQAATAHARFLGRYWHGENTDFQLVRRLLEGAEEIGRLTEGSGSVRPRRAGQRRRPPRRRCLRRRRPGARAARPVAADTRPGTPAGRTPKARHRHPRRRRRLVLGPSRAAGQRRRADRQGAAGTPTPASLTLDQARRIVARVEEIRAGRKAFLSQKPRDEQLLGPLYAGLDTDTAALTGALEWVSGVREPDAPMPEQAARALLAARPDEELRTAWNAFRAAVTDFAQLFDTARRHDLHARLTGTTADFDELTGRLAEDLSGPEEWRSFRTARDTLRRYRLDGLIDRAAEQGLDGADFPRAVERAVLEAWVEQIMAADSRLATVRAVERDKLVDQFRELDRALVANAHAEVIEACNERRPSTTTGPAAVIQREAEKKSRHMPVRALLREAVRHVPRASRAS